MVRTRGMERAALGAAALYVLTQWQRQRRMDTYFERLAFMYAAVYAVRLAYTEIRGDQVFGNSWEEFITDGFTRYYGPGMIEGFYQQRRPFNYE